MCPEWRDDFDTFQSWAMENGYRQDLTLDRVCNTRGYFPGNCRWVSRKAQANNRTTASYYTVNGKTRTLAQWSRMYDIPAHVILHRIENGWDVERAITEPRHVRKKRESDDETQ